MIVKLLRSLACLALAAGCGSQSGKPDAPGGPNDGAPNDGAPMHIPGMPGVGAWKLTYYKLDHMPVEATLSTAPATTQASGSTIIVSVGRGDNTLLRDNLSSAIPTDNKGNTPYQRLGTMHPYSLYPESGTALFGFPSAQGGAGFSVTTTAGKAVAGSNAGRTDEVSMIAVEVVEGTHIQDFSWVEDRTPPNTSASVTTTGPATLIAFWWGDGYSPQRQHIALMESDGFSLLGDNTQEADSFVQCAVAYKNVSAAGTYTVTWIPQPDQGAQLWLVAVQK